MRPDTSVRVEVIRSDRVESVHQVDAVVRGASGSAVLMAGQPDTTVFARSAIKPFQALPLVLDGVVDRFGITAEELALCCASHSGEPRHVAAARSILARAGVGENALACGPHEPFAADAAATLVRQGQAPGRIHNNCSGKHAGMLALARAHGWPMDGYHVAGHPVQERILDEVVRWTEVDADQIGRGVDGCGVVTFALALGAMAHAFARLAEDARTGGEAGRVLEAMAQHPFMVGGTDRLCSELIRRTGGRIIAKVGAEGMYTAAVLDRGLGLALKVRDGAWRAAEVALLAVLDAAGALEPGEREVLGRWAEPKVSNTRGETVGAIRARVKSSHG